MQYKAAIVGCGRIGVSFDSGETETVLTHAKAFSKHPRFNLVAVMDVDYEIAKSAGNRWKCEFYSDFQSMIKEQQPDIISICVPDKFHYEYLLQCLESKPKAVIAEKPLTLNINESEEVVGKYKKAGIPLFVNYTRRYDKFVQSLKYRIETGEIGRVLNATIKYTKGILHNGSHAIDVANFLFGEFLSARLLNSVIDYSEEDPTLSLVLEYEKCSELFLIACDESFYSIFEIDIMAEKGRIVLDQFGLRCREYNVRKDPIFKEYEDLALIGEYDTELKNSFLNMLDNIVQHLENGKKNICSGKDALLAQKICSELIESWNGLSN